MSSIAFGWVRIRRSLLPLTSRWKSAKRCPRNAASSYSRPWIMVPMAPSSTRMRSRAAASNAVRLGETGTVIGSGGLLCARGANAEQMAYREHEVGAVHGVEMKGVDAVLIELLHLAGRHGGRHQLARLGVVVEAFELCGEPVRDAGAGAGHEGSCLLEIMHRHDAGHDRNEDAPRANPVEISKVEVVIEKHLRNGAGRARIDLGFEYIDIGIEVRAFGMLFRIRRHRDFDLRISSLDAGHELGRGFVTIRMRGVGGADAAGRIAAKRHDVADADPVIAADDLVDLAPRSADASQMRGRKKLGFSEDAGDGGVGALAGRTARAIGHRHEIRSERRQALDGVPEALLHLFGFRRKELKGDCRMFQPALRCGRRNLGHGTHKLRNGPTTSGWFWEGQNRPSEPYQTAHHGWEIAQFIEHIPNYYVYLAIRWASRISG